MINMLSRFTFLSILVITLDSGAAEVLSNVQILKVYAQSRTDSTANLIKISASLPSVCNSDRLYIDFNDKELFATALSSYLLNKKVDVIYSLDGPEKVAAGHLALPCRVLSIF